MNKTTIHFVRHGAVENPADVYYGRLPGYRLSTIGREQALTAGMKIKDSEPIQKIYSSPLLRARQTANIIARHLGNISISYSHLINECYTPYTGLPAVELQARHWDLYTGNKPPYELPGDIFKRSHRFIKRVLNKHEGKNVIAVTHADIILFLSLWAEGYEVNYFNKARVERLELPITFPANASITTFTWFGNKLLPMRSYVDIPIVTK